MIIQKILRTCEGKWDFSEKDVNHLRPYTNTLISSNYLFHSTHGHQNSDCTYTVDVTNIIIIALQNLVFDKMADEKKQVNTCNCALTFRLSIL